MWTRVYLFNHFLLVFIYVATVYWLLFTYVYPSLLVFTNVYTWLPMFTPDY